MHSTLPPKPSDDPHDFVVVPPDAIRVVPSDDELSDLLHQAARHRPHAQRRAEPNFAAGATVPPVDTTFRATSVDDVLPPGERRVSARRALRGFIALLLAASVGVAALAWKSYGDAATKQIAKLATQLVLTSSLTSEKPALAEQPEPAAADAANTVSPQPAPVAQTAAEAAAPSGDQAQLLQSMKRDLASVRQEVEQLKASIAELKQPQVSRDVAKTSEAKASDPNARPRISAAPPRPAAARVRTPTPSYPQPQAAASSMPPQAVAPNISRPPEPQPQFAAEPVQADPELSSVPRPPMPLR